MATRKERVVLELEDRFTTPMAKAAVSAAALKKNLDDLDGSGRRTTGSLGGLSRPVGDLDRNSRLADQSINQLTGRLRLMLDVAATLGPALVPIGGAAVPALAGMATQLGLVAGAGGVAAAALVGLGDGLKALNEAQVEPTEENLAKMRLEMERLGPAGAAFVNYLDSIGPQLRELQMVAREGFLPGLEDGIDAMLNLGPRVQGIIGEIAVTMGDLSRASGEALSGEEFAGFFEFLDNRAGPLLAEFGRSVGNVAQGIANLIVGLDPLSSDFSSGLLSMTEAFAEWSRGLSSDAGFQGFVSYLRETGPQVVDLLGSIVRAVAGLVQAAAPIGQALLPVLTAVADAFAAIATSPIGTPLLAAAGAMAAFSRAAQLGSAVTAAFSTNLDATDKSARRAQQGMIALSLGAAAITTVSEASKNALPTVNELAAQLLALGDGRVTGLSDDMGDLRDSIGRLTDPNLLEQVGDSFLNLTPWEGNRLGDAKDEIAALDQALQSIASSGGVDAARQAFDNLARAEGLSADETERLRSLLPGYRDALAGATNAADLHASAADRSAAAEKRAAAATEEWRQALLKRRQAQLAAFDAETAYRQAVNDATDAEKRNTAGIRGNSEAALDNRSRLSALAAAWNNQTAAVRNNEDRQRAARQAFLRAAEGMGVSAQQARNLADRLLAIPTKREVQVRVLDQAARTAIDGLRNALDGIPDEDVRINITTVRREVAGAFSGLFGSADGGPIAVHTPAPIPAALTGQEALA